MSEKALVEIRSPGVALGERCLLRDFSFTWRKGEHWGIVGPNGSGKTTLIRLLTGELLAPGSSVTYGFPALKGREGSERIGTVSFEKQSETLAALDTYVQMRWNSTEEDSTPTLEDWLSYESVEDIGPFAIRESLQREKAAFLRQRAALLRRFDVERLLTRHVAELSNGETRRAFLVRALLTRPRLLLFDAPFTGLDDASCDIVKREMNHLAQGNATSLLVATVREENLPSCITHILRLERDTPPAFPSVAVSSIESIPPETAAPDAPAKPIVEFRNLHVAYGEHTVFEGFNWTLRRGERWLLTGPNGSGKSTLIALLNGDHLQAYANDIRLFGKRRGTGESIWDIKRRIGWVSPELHMTIDPTQSVLDCVLSGFVDSPFASGVVTSRQRRRARECLRSMGLDARERDAFCTLSGGEQRFVLLARALVKNPPLLVLDEPCQNLDSLHRTHFLELLDNTLAASPQTSLLYVTHLADAVPSCITHRLQLTLHS